MFTKQKEFLNFIDQHDMVVSGSQALIVLTGPVFRPHNGDIYVSNADAAALAASYGFGLAKNHAFVDGNKRTAFVAVELFLALNGRALDASDAECVVAMLALAAGELDEAAFADWIRGHLAAP